MEPADPYHEIPQEIRERIDAQVRDEAFALLHAELVAEGTLPAPPPRRFKGIVAWVLSRGFALGVGGLCGVLAAAFVALFALLFPTIL